MSEANDPPRLLATLSGSSEDGASDLRSALVAGQSELPTTDQLAGLWARLPMGPGGDGGSDGGGAEGDGGLGGDLDPGGLDGGIDLGGGAAAGASGAGIAAKAAGGAGVAAKTAGGVGLTKILGAVALAGVAVGMPVYLSTRGADSESANRPIATVSAPGPIDAAPVEMTEKPAVDVAAPEPTDTAAAEGAPPAQRAAPSAEEPVPSEVSLLQQAQSALGSDPGRALSLVNRAARLHPQGSLGQEREMIRIQALLGTGRRSEARAAAARFRAGHPGSPHNRRLETLFPGLAP